MSIKIRITNLLNKMPYIKGLHNYNKRLIEEKKDLEKMFFYPVGHFYSTIVSVNEIKERDQEIWQNQSIDNISAVNLQAENQRALMHKLENYYDEMPFTSEKQSHLRFFFDNGFFAHTDSILLYSMIRHLKPKQIIEIGSGYSSAVMLDTNELFMENKIKLTFIEPYPERLYAAITEKDNTDTTILVSNVQSVPIETFEELNAGDILFVDSSHVVKTGSDVCFILFDILPKLKSGVIIHFHDIFYPFEYLKEWVYEGRNWNECYFLKSFLMYNDAFQIVLFPDYLHKHHKDVFKNMPLCYQNHGGSLWFTKK
jgi:predicted O-methyltransferase YrrM